MSYFLTEEQEIIRGAAHNFARKVVEPIAAEIDRTDETPHELVAGCAEQGFFGIYTPEEYGGIGTSLLTACLVLEEIAKASPAFAGLLSVQAVLCPATVTLLGTEEQKRRLLPASAAGASLMAYSQTEPAGAMNVRNHLTRLTESDRGYRLNGAKLFCTQGEAKTYLVFARTQKEDEAGYGCAIVSQDAPGFHVAPYEDKLGWRGTNTGSISFEDIEISPENVLGSLLTANYDHRMAARASLIGHSVTSLGCAEGLFEKTLAYIKERTLYDEPMHRLSPISHALADIHNKIEAARCLLYSCIRLMDEGRDNDRPMGSVCKAYVCDTMYECCNRLLQFWGGSGIMNSTGVNRYIRDARTNMIAEGAQEMQYSIVSQRILGLI
jgi:alkylation response protein AidB-like acyl-CoA dehydrogenase